MSLRRRRPNPNLGLLSLSLFAVPSAGFHQGSKIWCGASKPFHQGRPQRTPLLLQEKGWEQEGPPESKGPRRSRRGSAPSSDRTFCGVGSETRRSFFRTNLGAAATAGVSTAWLGLDPIPHQKSLAWAMSKDPKTGIALPDPGEIEAAVPTDWGNVENPFLEGDSSSLFSRLDNTNDSIFYSEPRFVEHVDENAVHLLTEYISNEALAVRPTEGGIAVLDLASSWTSHIDPKALQQRDGYKTKVTGLGMNAKELQANPILREWTVQDLNKDPKLPYPDQSFDVVLIQLSIDYLTRPLEVLQEIARVLKPGGKVHILFSNRLFLTKAVGLWTGADDIDHAYYVSCYLHFCRPGAFERIAARDLSSRKKNRMIVGDPMYVVTGQRPL